MPIHAAFKVSVEESHAVLKKVLPLMSQQRVPTIPQNYTVWYDFVCEADPELVAELGERMAQGLKFSPDACQRIYEKYFVNELKTEVNEIQGAMSRAMASAVAELDGLDDELGRYAASLEAAELSLTETEAPVALAGLVARLADETRLAQARSAAAEASLKEMKSQLESLQIRVEALSRDSGQDRLTGVASRRAFDDGLRRMLLDAETNHAALCVLLADIDAFDGIGAQLGREVADVVLRFVAQEMDQCVKGRDLLARYQGARFAILLPATSYNGALMLAESIRAIIEAQVVCTDDGAEIEDFTLSLGVACHRPGEDGSALIDRAEACLRQAQAQGGNRVTGERDLRA